MRFYAFFGCHRVLKAKMERLKGDVRKNFVLTESVVVRRMEFE